MLKIFRNHISLVVLALLLVPALAGCVFGFNAITGSGNVITQEYDFTDFNNIDIGHAFKVNITPGDSYSVVVRVDDNIVDKLLVEQKDSRVTIGLQQGTVVTQATLEADIILPDLNRLDVSGAAQVQLNDLDTVDTFIAEASGASRIQGGLTANDVELEASGTSNITLVGSGANVVAKASGVSKIDLEGFEAVDAQTEASGTSTVIVNIVGILDADVSGASNVYYVGNPEMGIIDTSGGSNVEPR